MTWPVHAGALAACASSAGERPSAAAPRYRAPVEARSLLLASGALLAVLATGSCSAPDPVPVAGTAGHAFATRVPEAPIENFAQLTPAISRGAQPDERGLRYLAQQGFRTVVNLRSHHSEREEAEALGLRYVELPLRADLFGSTAPTNEEVRRFFAIVLDPSAQPVFFHCAHGKDRTGTRAALYRIEVDGWTNEEAIEEMLAFGYHTIYQDLIDYVRAYEPQGLGQPR